MINVMLVEVSTPVNLIPKETSRVRNFAEHTALCIDMLAAATGSGRVCFLPQEYK